MTQKLNQIAPPPPTQQQAAQQTLTLPQTQQQVAQQAFESAVSPLRQEFQERLGATTEQLAQRGIQFGGVGQQRLGDIFKEQQRVEGQIASGLGAQLGQQAMQQAFQTSESARAREFQAEQAGLGRQFTAEQAGLGREFTAQEAQRARDYNQVIQQQQQQFQASREDIRRQDVRNDQLVELVISGNIKNQGEALEAIERIFGQGIALTPQDDVDLQRVAMASGLSAEDFSRLRSAIGQGQLAAVLRDPSQYIMDPEANQRFQLELARIQAQSQVQAAEAQSGGGKKSHFCMEFFARDLISRRQLWKLTNGVIKGMFTRGDFVHWYMKNANKIAKVANSKGFKWYTVANIVPKVLDYYDKKDIRTGDLAYMGFCEWMYKMFGREDNSIDPFQHSFYEVDLIGRSIGTLKIMLRRETWKKLPTVLSLRIKHVIKDMKRGVKQNAIWNA